MENPLTVPITGFKYAHGGPKVERPPQPMGAQTDEILKELGFNTDEIAILKHEGVI